jgi:galactokinase/mevalonate kinase-like predicted kinase
MSDGFGIGDLSGTADAVGAGADGLGGMSAPDLPDAGVSSASLAGVLGAMSSVISNVVGTAAAARRQVTVNHQSYQDTDRGWQSVFAMDEKGKH